jgi:type IV fimbrial biogenesis protein FimT
MSGVMNNRGFTLVELMITIAVLAIALSLAIPSFTATIARNKLTSARDDLIKSFQFTKSEAINRNVSVVICPSINGTSCSGTGDWEEGWIIYLEGAMSAGVTSTVGTVIKVNEGFEGLNSNHIGVPSGLTPSTFVRYVPQGFAAYAGPILAQTIELCSQNGEVGAVSMVVSAATGQVRPQAGGC